MLLLNNMVETRKVHSSENNGEKYLKESWFKAYRDGNILIPLKYGGIVASVTESLFKDPPDQWEDFSQATFSQEQLEFLKKMAMGIHREHKVQKYGGMASEQIFESRLNSQLKDAKRILQDRLLDLLGDSNRGQDLNWSEIMNSEKGKKISKILSEAMGMLRKNQAVKSATVARHKLLAAPEKVVGMRLQIAQKEASIVDSIKENFKDSKIYEEDPDFVNKVLSTYFLGT